MLEDVCFIIPFRFDFQERVDNLTSVLTYLSQFTDAEIRLCEDGKTSKVKELFEDKLRNVKNRIYKFYQSNSSIIYRTKMVNTETLETTKPIIIVIEADVIIPKENIIEACEAIRNKKADLVYPHDSHSTCTFKDVSNWEEFKKKSDPKRDNHCVGGCWVWNKEKFIEGGMENPNCHGWGFDGNEIDARFHRLECKCYRMEGILYHLYHQGKLQHAEGIIATAENKKQFDLAKNLPIEDLKKHVKSWSN